MSLKMYITDKDNETLKYVETYGSITVRQCGKLFYNNQSYSNQTANKKLNKLVRYGKLKVSKDISGNANVYYYDKKLSYHDLLILDFYCELKSLGVKIHYFKSNKSWLDDSHISDGFFCYSIADKLFFNIVEIVRTHRLDKKKYIKLYESNEVQQFCNDLYQSLGGTDQLNIFPRVILIDAVQHTDNYLYINDNIKVIQLDFKMNNFSSIFV
jgi:hypothetical protein